MTPTKILAIYRGKVLLNRGTPIRVRSLLTHLNGMESTELTVASWDESAPVFSRHIVLTNNHIDDLKKLYRYVKDNKIAVVVGHTVATSYYLIPLKFLTGVKIVLEMHGFGEEESREYGDIGLMKYWVVKLWSIFFYSLCDLITSCSKSVTDILLRYNFRSETLCGGVDRDRFNSSVASGNFFKKDSRIVIGYAGNARMWQGLDFLIAAFKKISEQTNDFRLVLLLSERKGLVNDGVAEVFGPVENEDVPKFLTDCDILIIPRPDTPVTRISFPSKLPEYLAMGKAIVASNLGDVDQIIVPGVNGLLYTPGNQEEFIGKVLSLRDAELRRRLGAGAAETAQKLSWDRLARTWLEYIQKIM